IKSLIIPFKNANEIIRVFSEEDGDLEVFYDDNQITFKNKGITLTSRLIDGVYPDYRQILPKDFKTKVFIDKEEISQALKLSNIFSNKFHQIHFHISTKDD